MTRQRRLLANSLATAIGIACLSTTSPAQVGTTLRVITVPVASPSCCGIGVAVDCNGDLYYTNYGEPVLRRIDAFGALLGSVPLTRADMPGVSISFGAIAWDNTRGKIWGGTDSLGIPIQAWLIDPATGVATFQFSAATAGCCGFTDGMAYDAGDDSIWWSDDVASSVDHQAAVGGAPMAGSPLFPTDAGGSPITAISGCLRGVGDVLYLGHNGSGEIIKVKASDGTFLSIFSSPGGRDEDLECDAINFFPKTAIWSKDAYNNMITAIEVEDGTCACSGQQVVPFCFGDDPAFPCPCLNSGDPGNGCANSDHPGGANLSASGTPSLGLDTLVLTAADIHAASMVIFIQGDTEVMPMAFGDGLRCIAGIRRLFRVKNAHLKTVSAPSLISTPPTPATVSGQSAAKGDVLSVGDVRAYQVYYRDPMRPFCPNPPGDNFNITNAIRVTWGP